MEVHKVIEVVVVTKLPDLDLQNLPKKGKLLDLIEAAADQEAAAAMIVLVAVALAVVPLPVVVDLLVRRNPKPRQRKNQRK